MVTHEAILPTSELYEALGEFNGSPSGDIFDFPLREVDTTDSIRNDGLVSVVDGLEKECGYALVPGQYAEGGKDVKVTLTAKRSCSPTPHKVYPLDIGALGWGEPGEVQLCYVDVKGSGAPRLQQPVFDRTLYMSSRLFANRPYGSQNRGFAESSLKHCLNLKGSRIKIAPVFEAVTLPEDVSSKIREMESAEAALEVFDKDKKLLRDISNMFPFPEEAVPFAQEKRLIPSGIRADRLMRRLGLVSANKVVEYFDKHGIDFDNLVSKIFQDARNWLENVPFTTRKSGGNYSWQCVGHIQHPRLYKNPLDLERSIDSTLPQDIVISPSGAYFVDLESLDTIKTPAKDLREYHRHYLRTVLCTFTRLISGLRHSYWFNNFPQFRRRQDYLPRDILSELGSELESGDTVRLKTGPNSVSMSVTYPHIGKEERFRFSLNDYMPQFRRLADLEEKLGKNL